MKLEAIKTGLTQLAGRGGLYAQKYSPEILIGVGVVSVVASAVLAARATLKLERTVDDVRADVEIIKGDVEDGKISEEDVKKDLVYAQTKGVIKVVKLYAPSATLMIAGIACIIGAHGILKQRNVALIAAYKALEASYSQYRRRVSEDLGEDKDREYAYGIKAEMIKDENGVDRKIYTVDDLDPNKLSPYARIFDENNVQWSKTPEYNLLFLRSQQNYMNDMLRARGHVTLNDVYDALNMERSKAGMVVGWVLNKGGDNYVDFGIYETRNSNAINSTTSRADGSYLLDFNVDGLIQNLI